MKKIAIVLLLAMQQAFAGSTYSTEGYGYEEVEENVDDSEESVYGTVHKKTYVTENASNEYRSGFFWRMTTGLNIDFGDVWKESYKSKEAADFSVAGDIFSFQIGANLKRLYALYFGVDFAVGSGDYCFYSYDDGCLEADLFKFNVNVGTLLYPFRSVPVLRGVNFGASVGFEGEFITVPSTRYRDETDMALDLPGVALKTELGYTWDVSRRISLGVEFNFTFNFLISLNEEDDRLGEDTDVSAEAYSIGILFNIMHR
ncbi:MAG: hypothetical protein MJY85_04335 [Fibrobacter sp.]|nr:hypothetical protein [Fibrobacter sp.]